MTRFVVWISRKIERQSVIDTLADSVLLHRKVDVCLRQCNKKETKQKQNVTRMRWDSAFHTEQKMNKNKHKSRKIANK